MTYTLDEIADKLRRKAAGEWDALDDCWAERVAVWRCYHPHDSVRGREAQASSSREKHEILQETMPDFKRESTFHVSPATDSVIEESLWTGTAADGTAQRLFNCTVYSIRNGEIERMQIYYDEAKSKIFAFGEVGPDQWPEHLQEAAIEIQAQT